MTLCNTLLGDVNGHFPLSFIYLFYYLFTVKVMLPLLLLSDGEVMMQFSGLLYFNYKRLLKILPRLNKKKYEQLNLS